MHTVCFCFSLARVSCEHLRRAARECLGSCWVGGRVRDAYITFEPLVSPSALIIQGDGSLRESSSRTRYVWQKII